MLNCLKLPNSSRLGSGFPAPAASARRDPAEYAAGGGLKSPQSPANQPLPRPEFWPAPKD